MERDSARDIKVGLFVFATVLLGAVAVYLLGGSSTIFEERYQLNASFQDVGGLREGAVVRLAGFDVGEVNSIRFSEDIGVKEVFIDLSLYTRFQPRIRKDSLARIETEGMLGDKYVSLTVGSVAEPILNDGDWLTVRESTPLVEYQKQANEVLFNLQGISRKVNVALGDDDAANQASVANVIQSVERVLKEAETGGGLLHTLVYDKALSAQLKRTVGNLETSSEQIAAITQEIRTGDGIASELIYGDGGEELATQLSTLATAMETLVSDIQSDQSLVHAMLYDPEKAQMVEDLAVTAAALRTVAEGIENGDGTLGLLAKDPALYEDLRALVNGAERNTLLRYYIRRTVAEGEKEKAEPWAP